ncbi:orotate phosphoribosyltransferase [Govanella unica]|uniref:Orotate phosphoribosyltransferase n=1 Tax=Govanella unica TaxID=2975056 RepID=A0A9X3TYR5_9PROT|nr:orotate phosphoribosyltransferase [Govania unica]MDA5194263.1 orotate phosphoribosyltransferase [Govania unica]
MEHEEVLNHFRDAGALLEGHFLLSSGLHSPVYLQCARVMMDARRGEILCKALADTVRAGLKEKIDLVVAPAMGGILVGYELGRQLGVPTIFAERVEGTFTIRRGFSIPDGAKILLSEDIVTTGLSSRECINVVRKHGGDVVAAACLIDRSNGRADVGVPLFSLTRLDVPAYESSAVPPELAAIPAEKPGSRGLN